MFKPKLEFDNLRALGFTGNINDMLVSFFRGEGETGALPDMYRRWLLSEGYTGTLSEMLKQFADDGYPFSAGGGWETVDFSDLMDHQYDPRSVGNTTATDGSDILFTSFDDLIGATALPTLSVAVPENTGNRPIHTLAGNAIEENGQQAMASIDRDGTFNIPAGIATSTRTIAFLIRGNGLANAPYSLLAASSILPMGNAGTSTRIPFVSSGSSTTDLILPTAGTTLYINGVEEFPTHTTYANRGELFTAMDDSWVSVIATRTSAFSSTLWYGASRNHDGRHIMGSFLTSDSTLTPSEVSTIHTRLTSTAFEYT